MAAAYMRWFRRSTAPTMCMYPARRRRRRRAHRVVFGATAQFRRPATIECKRKKSNDHALISTCTGECPRAYGPNLCVRIVEGYAAVTAVVFGGAVRLAAREFGWLCRREGEASNCFCLVRRSKNRADPIKVVLAHRRFSPARHRSVPATPDALSIFFLAQAEKRTGRQSDDIAHVLPQKKCSNAIMVRPKKFAREALVHFFWRNASEISRTVGGARKQPVCRFFPRMNTLCERAASNENTSTRSGRFRPQPPR